MIPDWLLPTVTLAPAMLWMFLGIGLPWALAVLPRAAWRHHPVVLAVALALGPALHTTIMFIIGTFAHFSRENVLAASAALALIGLFLALRRRAAAANTAEAQPWTAIDLTLLFVTVIAVLLRFWNTAYWPFTTYDALWVYGYNARVFMLTGSIPASMGYYPQLIPLSYTYGQLMWGGINDHAARVVLPWFAMTGILMAYVLGAALFNRRVGLLTAAIWALYPQHAVWSQFGDLEVTVTLYFTGTLAFFALGWRERQWRYILVSGLMLGAALWTKPTAGALVISIGLVGAAGGIMALRGAHWRALWRSPALRDALLALIVALPMGGMWYIRNVLYGLPPLLFPASYWQDSAQRSGQELGWPLLIALAGLLWLVLKGRIGNRRLLAAVGGTGLLLIGSLPSAFGGRLPTTAELSQVLVGQIADSIKPTRLGLLEFGLIFAGTALLIWAALPAWRALGGKQRGVILIVVAFIAPYAVTWFWSYSYHYRLSFPIVPALIVLLAALIEASARGFRLNRLRLAAAVTVIVALSLPGWWGVLSALEPAVTSALATDDAKIARGNPALMGLVDFLRQRREALQRPLKVIAPGELRLNFFFPLDDIRGDIYPLWLDDVANVDYYIDSSVGQKLYAIQGTLYNQIIASRTRLPVMRREFTIDDGNFRFSAYSIDNAARFTPPDPNGKINVQIGDFAVLLGYDLSTLIQKSGQNISLTLYWKALKPADLDYSIFVHFWDPEKQLLGANWSGQPVERAFSVWEGVPGEHFSVAYPTRLWQTGEFIKDEWRIRLPQDMPAGTYELRVGLFDALSGTRLPVTMDGVGQGDSVLLNLFKAVR